MLALDEIQACDIVDTAPKNIPISTILQYKNKGLSDTEISRLVGCSQQNISQRLQEYRLEIDGLKAFKENRADTFAVLESKLLNSLCESDIKSMSAGSRITGAAILYDKERLERGQSTQNIAYTDMSRRLSELDNEINRLSEELGDIIEQE